MERVGKNQTFDNDTFISYIEYHDSDYYNYTSKNWQIAYYQHCLSLMINEEAKQYATQTMVKQWIIHGSPHFNFPLFKWIMASFFPMSKLFCSSMLQSLINSLISLVKLPTRQAMRDDICKSWLAFYVYER